MKLRRIKAICLLTLALLITSGCVPHTHTVAMTTPPHTQNHHQNSKGDPTKSSPAGAPCQRECGSSDTFIIVMAIIIVGGAVASATVTAH